MVKKINRGDQKGQKSRVKVGKLQINKETVKNLTGSERKKNQGGREKSGRGPLQSRRRV